jgi:hypothetical protein
MHNERLNFLIRKNKGKGKLDAYKSFFNELGFAYLKYIELDEADKVLMNIKKIFPSIERECEWLTNDASSTDSKLLMEIINTSSNELCYVFTDDVYECGMFLSDVKSAINNSLTIAKSSFENTCFITSQKLNFSFTINYYDEDHINFKNEFDIQRRVITIK